MILRNKLLIKLMSPGLWVLCFFHAQGRGGAGEEGGKEGGGKYELICPPGEASGGTWGSGASRGAAGAGGGVEARWRARGRESLSHKHFHPRVPLPGPGLPRQLLEQSIK